MSFYRKTEKNTINVSGKMSINSSAQQTLHFSKYTDWMSCQKYTDWMSCQKYKKVTSSMTGIYIYTVISTIL